MASELLRELLGCVPEEALFWLLPGTAWGPPDGLPGTTVRGTELIWSPPPGTKVYWLVRSFGLPGNGDLHGGGLRRRGLNGSQ